ncbi:MAG: twin-arginine translocase subunit TatB [Betaproteobacteria bacterium]|nr:twin-arginine translocase subunit TatB [Betaproteobacteria bacterium]
MFDIGFSELVVIAVVALIVIGPERLPKAARTMGHLFGRLQRYVSDVKADISREMELDELRKLQQQVQTAAHDFKSSVATAAQGVQSGVRNVEDQLNSGALDPARTADPSAAPPAAAPAIGEQPLAAAAEEPSTQPGRQPSLPGFERI